MMSRPAHPETTVLLDRAIACMGSQAKLGEATGRSQNAVWHARSTGRVTAEFALAIDRVTDGQVSKHELRPDIYGLAIMVEAAQ